MHTLRSLVRRSAAALIAAAGILAALGPAQAQAQSERPFVGLFSDANYSNSATLTHSSVPDLASLGFAGRASSLRVVGGAAVAAYSEPNYGGRCETFTSQDEWLGDNAIGNDAIRSIKVGYTCFGQVPGRVVVTDVAVVARLHQEAAGPQPGRRGRLRLPVREVGAAHDPGGHPPRRGAW